MPAYRGEGGGGGRKKIFNDVIGKHIWKFELIKDNRYSLFVR